MFGFLNINKPKGMTSHDVIARLRKICKIKQIGHAGTLDPMAQGVLPIAIGKATRLLEYLPEEKAYIADLEFGKISDTYDTEGHIETFSDEKINKKILLNTIKIFQGEIEQIPPAYSAVHYNGKRLYELARQGIIPDDIPKRKVFISECDLIDFSEEKQTAKLKISCSKGTYIRTIVHDLGQELGVGAVMSELTRINSSGFCIKNSLELENIKEKESINSHIINPLDVLSYPKRKINDDEYEKIKHGMAIKDQILSDKTEILLVKDNKLCAIANTEKGLISVKKVFVE